MEIGVLQAREVGEWERYSGYIGEILAHAGLPYRSIEFEALENALEALAVLLLPTHIALPDDTKVQLRRFVKEGRVLIGLGGPSELEDIFGCRDLGPIREAWIGKVDNSHPVIDGITGTLHAFGGREVALVDRNTQVLAHWLDGDRWSEADGWANTEIGPAITLHQYGAGCALLVAVDVVHSVLRIQQGRPVHVDGRPAPDGSAPINDGILKAEDGIVLDYERDRGAVAGVRWFTHPIADEWRELIIRGILWGVQVTGSTLPMLWYWPDGIPAIGHISHDTDHNRPNEAEALLRHMMQLGISSTWCVQYPGGYAPDFYRQLIQEGYEIALHFDAHSNVKRTSWREDDFQHQLDWLSNMASTTITSNKNHITRWEGLTEFFPWLAARGVLSDQTKGPSKMGTKGFLFGGSHPWFPMDEHSLQPIDVLEVNLHAQDLTEFCPYEVGPEVIDQVRAHHGVAHFLFHPARIEKPAVPDALSRVVKYGQERGLVWWTNDRIQAWERARRQVRFQLEQTADGFSWVVDSSALLDGATLLLFGAKQGDRASEQTVYGFRALQLIVDLDPAARFSLNSLNEGKR